MVEDRKISFLSKHLRRRLWVQTPGQGDVTMFVYGAGLFVLWIYRSNIFKYDQIVDPQRFSKRLISLV